MFDKIREKYDRFLNYPPGERFTREYERRKDQRRSQPGWKSGVYVVFGILLILLGFIIGIFPGVPGILLSLVGFIIIAARSYAAAKVLDILDLLAQLIRKKIRKQPGKKRKKTS